jgi:hypothetical protein
MLLACTHSSGVYPSWPTLRSNVAKTVYTLAESATACIGRRGMRGDQQHGSPHELQLSTPSSLSRFPRLRGRSTFSPHALHFTALQALRLHRLFTAVVIVHQLLQGNTNLDSNTRHHVLIPVTAAGAHGMFHPHVLGAAGHFGRSDLHTRRLR